MSNIENNAIVSEPEWNKARVELLVKEKKLARLREEIAADRRALPWQAVKEDYVFNGPAGEKQLSELFGSKSQLIVVHFMYGPEWQEGCKSCSFFADQHDAVNMHLGARDVSLVVISRAQWPEFQNFKARMQWDFEWLSSSGNTFNADYHVSFPGQESGYYNYKEGGVAEELPGVSIFYKDDTGAMFHTYSTYARGLDTLMSTYQMLDLVPKGRDEADLPFTMSWLKHHDSY
ncbi:MAG: DUF899 domain-containing protein [Pseudomonadales bacterium]